MTSHSSTRRNRRSLLRVLAGAAGLALTLGTLAACAPPDDSSGGSGGNGGASSSEGGTLTLGMHGNSSESVDPHTSVSAGAAEARIVQLYDPLTRLDPDGQVQWALATDMTPNDDLTQWTVKLREGVTTHKGEDFGADDVIFSVKRILDPDRSASGAPLISDVVDPDGITKIDDHTVEFDLKKPYGPFKEMWADVYLQMVPTGFDPDDPDGTGPFEYVSATPGQQSTFKRFDDYWGDAPKVDTLKIVDFQGMDAIINALRGGQIDVAALVPFSQADSLAATDGIKILESKANYHLTMFFRLDKAPFDDPRVLNAVRLLVDRDQVVQNAFDGHGEPANDISYRSTPSCAAPDVPQRTQDIAKAKKLLAEAGQSDLSFTIATANDQPGMLEMAQVLQQNAKKAGVTVKIDTMDTAGYLAKWKEWPVGIGFSSAVYPTVIKDNLMPGAGSNAGHFNDDEFVKLAGEYFATADADTRCEIQQKMQKISYERGPYLIPAWTDILTAYRDNVSGLQPVKNGYPQYFLNKVTVE